MRRLMEALYRVFFGIRIQTHEQHIADLEAMLSRALDEQLHIDVEVTQLTQRLLDAMAHRDALHDIAHKRRRESDAIDWSAIDQFPDPAPRRY